MNPLLIVGFHRSGTSAVARLLHGSGLHLGDSLLGAEPSNPYGHFEDVEAISLHDDALAAQGLSWKSTSPVIRRDALPLAKTTRRIEQIVSDRSIAGRPWGVKDPRMCLFLPEWLHAAPRAQVLVVARRPSACIDSLHRRHARRYIDTRRIDPSDITFWQQPDLGLELWIHYYEQVLDALPASDRVHVVNFADRPAVEALPSTLAAKWDLPLKQFDAAQLDPDLGVDHGRIEVRDTALIRHANVLWEQLASQGR